MPKTSSKTKKKPAAKKKKAKKSAESNSPDACYDAFMTCVQKAEKAKTAKTRNKWIKAAETEYETLLACGDELSASQRRRAKRTKAFLDEELAAAN